MNELKLQRPSPEAGFPPQSIPVVLVTPEVAKEWLDTRFENERSLHKNKVLAFARDMEQDNWHFTGDTIRFDAETGRLMDGQHRLQALVISKTSQWFPIVNLPIEARAGIDTGSARTLGELLHMGNHMHGRILAAIVRRLLVYRNGLQGSSGGRYLPTHTEDVRFTQENEELLRKAATVANRVQAAGLPGSPSSVGAAYFLCARVDQDQADDFFEKVATGLGLEEGDPVAAFRNKLIKYAQRNKMNVHADQVFRFAIIAWNYKRKGVSIVRLSTPRDGWTNSNVPMPE